MSASDDSRKFIQFDVTAVLDKACSCVRQPEGPLRSRMRPWVISIGVGRREKVAVRTRADGYGTEYQRQVSNSIEDFLYIKNHLEQEAEK